MPIIYGLPVSAFYFCVTGLVARHRQSVLLLDICLIHTLMTVQCHCGKW